MEFTKNKLYIIIAAVILIVAVGLSVSSHRKIEQAKLVEWITQSYSQQFCTVIYPRIADCVTFHSGQCNSAANEEITDCINSNRNELPDDATPTEAKKIFDSLSNCFEQNMHDLIMQEYLVPSPECQQKLK